MPIQRQTILDYLTITSGVFGRLAISVIYFLIIANVLDIGNFGIFASASAVGLVLSRILAFGFISPVYRVATARHRLLGTYTAGLIIFALMSIPVILFAGFLIHRFGFSGKLSLLHFSIIIASEIIGWRVVEYVVIMLNGLNRFGKAAALVITGSAIRTVAAIAFFLFTDRSFTTWIWLYGFANLVTLAIGLLGFLPVMRLRFVWKLYPRRVKDSLTAAASEITFYIQSELDKFLVLTMAGDKIAGLYAIAMRLIDLTAVPIRSFNQMLIQKIMKQGDTNANLLKKIGIEGAIAIISILGLLGFVVLLWLFPAILGNNVARVTPYLLPMLAIPAFRNLIEYQTELLYAHEKVVTRTILLATLAALKLALMAIMMQNTASFEAWPPLLTGIFALLYCVSVLVTYRSLAAIPR
jgi:O-antigen/teichoic acid export membrane protein